MPDEDERRRRAATLRWLETSQASCDATFFENVAHKVRRCVGSWNGSRCLGCKGQLRSP